MNKEIMRFIEDQNHFIDNLAQEVRELREQVRNLHDTVWILKYPPKFKIGDVVYDGNNDSPTPLTVIDIRYYDNANPCIVEQRMWKYTVTDHVNSPLYLSEGRLFTKEEYESLKKNKDESKSE
jgi:hypothetical protein